MNIKDVLRKRFDPIPADINDPDLKGLLFVRRLTMLEFQRYMKALKDGTDPDAMDKQALLLSLAVCDSDGNPVFDSQQEAAELLGECWISLIEQVSALMFPGASEEGNPTAPRKTRSRGSSSGLPKK